MDARERCDDRASVGGFGVAALVGLEESVVEFALGVEGSVSSLVLLDRGANVDFGGDGGYGCGCGRGCGGGCG